MQRDKQALQEPTDDAAEIERLWALAPAHLRVIVDGESTRLRAALAGMVRWFGDYPEMIPNEERHDEYRAAIARARKALAE
jgi:hypothetical protein